MLKISPIMHKIAIIMRFLDDIKHLFKLLKHYNSNKKVFAMQSIR